MSSKIVADLAYNEHVCVIMPTNERATNMNNHGIGSCDGLELDTMVLFMATVELLLIPHRPTDSHGRSIEKSKCLSQEAAFCLDSLRASSKQFGWESYMIPKKQMLPTTMNQDDNEVEKIDKIDAELLNKSMASVNRFDQTVETHAKTFEPRHTAGAIMHITSGRCKCEPNQWISLQKNRKFAT